MKVSTEEEIECIKCALREHHQRLRRLEGVEGAERPLVPTTRSEEGPGVAEQRSAERSAEGRAVPPGKAKAAFQLAIKVLGEDAAFYAHAADRFRKDGNRKESVKSARRAAGRRQAIKVLTALLPKPDSDADTPSRAPEPFRSGGWRPDPYPSGKRSGRRNVEVAREAGEKQP